MDILLNSIVFRGIERLLIVGGGIFSIYLGYRLYRFGIDAGHSKVHFKSHLINLVVAGTGPGVFLIVFGSIVLINALDTGAASLQKRSGPTKNAIEKQQELLNEQDKTTLETLKKLRQE